MARNFNRFATGKDGMDIPVKILEYGIFQFPKSSYGSGCGTTPGSESATQWEVIGQHFLKGTAETVYSVYCYIVIF